MEAAHRHYTSIVTLQGIDVGGELYLSWEWSSREENASDGGFLTPDPESLSTALDQLDAALPHRPDGPAEQLLSSLHQSALFLRAGEFSQKVQDADREQAAVQDLAMVANAAGGPLARATLEQRMAGRLGKLLLPKELTDRLRSEKCRTVAPNVLIQVMPSQSCAQVPWEILRTGNPDYPDERLIELGDVVTMATLLARDGNADRRHPSWADRSGKPVLVIDPKLGPGLQVLKDEHIEGWRERIGRDARPFLGARNSTTAQDLTAALLVEPRPSRLLFVGHVKSGRAPWEIALLLAGDEGGDRPHTAFEVLLLEDANDSALGAPTSDSPVPPRVALVACESGPDLAFKEPFGLVTAYLEHGAELVTATRWTMLTDQAFELMGAESSPFNDLALAVDNAHETEDPVRELCAWQRGRLHAWRMSGDIGDSPLTWAAVSNWVAPDRTIRAQPDRQDP